MFKKIFLSILAITLFSCASAPELQKPDLDYPVPENWTYDIKTRVESDSLWWKEFKDENLDTILKEAFRNNKTLHIAATNVLSSASQARIAGAPIVPHVNLSVDGSKRKQNFIGFPIPGSEGSVLSNTSESYGVALNLTWEIDLWGKLRADQAAALANVQAAQADMVGAKLSLTGQVCKVWFAAIEAKRQVELSEATVSNLRVSFEQIKLRYERGLRSSLEYRMSMSSLATAESTLIQRKTQYENTVRQLEILLGRYPSAELEIGSSLPVLIEEVPSGLPAEVITRRPDLISAERTLASSKMSISRAKRALFPQLSLTASTGTTTKEIKELLNGDFSVWSLAGNIVQPIFQRGRLLAEVDLAKQSADMALAQYAQSVLIAFSEVEGALTNEKYLSQREVSLDVAVEQSKAARDLAEEQYSNGLSDFITMLDAQRTAYDNESQLLTLQRERLDARIDLYLALGGSFNYDISQIYGADKNE